MVHAGSDVRQANGDVHAVIQTVELDRDEALVVVEADHQVKGLAEGAFFAGTREDRVGWPRP